ncbi:hypothetical protein LAZ67_19000487 [Cordylochernes scorpioides]|uniref:SRCR domain-containing protein n=1 Tax=Cordylochernes scorpioides TaxID=51811 RepID=A0ABY6LH71_9ARAC|nr:hypothetical protein LAZ67_19000487 [Cordylochernes scorpioides]
MFLCDRYSRPNKAICADYSPDVGIRCRAPSQPQLTFYQARNERQLAEERTTYRRTSLSLLENVTLAGVALHSEGTPPRLRGLKVHRAGVSALLPAGASLRLRDSEVISSPSYGIFVNASGGRVELDNVTVRDSAADGVRHVFHRTVVVSKDKLCQTGGQGLNQVYPLRLTHYQGRDERNVQGCQKSFEVNNLHGQMLTLHFPTLISDEDKPELAGRIKVFDGRFANRRLLADFPVLNTTRPQSLVSTRNVIMVQYIPPQNRMVLFTIDITSNLGRGYDLDIHNSTIANNNGRGVVIEDMRSGLVMNHTRVYGNTHVAGVHVLGGVGDILINNSRIEDNDGDGLNVTYGGGFRRIDRSVFANNTRRGLAFWYNETSESIAFNFTLHISRTIVADNRLQGIYLSNLCHSDSQVNISLNHLYANLDDALRIESCTRNPKGIVEMLITHNIFERSRWHAIYAAPLLNADVLIEGNKFAAHERGVVAISNPFRTPDHFANLTVSQNFFTGNKGYFVAKLRLLEGSTNQTGLVTKNHFVDNHILEPFTKLKPRSRTAAVLAIGSSNIQVLRNRFRNPQSIYELASHLSLQSAVINASLNYWGTANASAVYDRIFDRKDRFNLALVEFLQFLIHPSDLDTETVISNVLERDKITPFQAGDLIGGEVAGNVLLDQGRYRVHRDIFVKSESQLILHPDTVLEFDQAIGIMVQGRLVSEGLDDNKIIYRMAAPAGHILMASPKMNLTEKLPTSPQAEPFRMPENTNPLTKTVRLSQESSGRLEVFVDGQWGSVCRYGWDIEDAAVVCHQLGFVLNEKDWLLEQSEFESRLNPQDVLLNNVQCTELDTNLAECRAERQNDFENSCQEEVGMKCYPPSWAGVRLGMEAKESSLKNVIIEQAGLFDYALHLFRPALLVDFNRHILEKLTLQSNTDSGVGIMWNDIFAPTNRKISLSVFTNNQNHGIELRAQGMDITDSRFDQNLGSAIQYDPYLSQMEHLDLLSWLDDRDVLVSAPNQNIYLGANQRRYLRFKATPYARYTFNVTTDAGRKVGIMVLSDFEEESTESLEIFGRLDITPDTPVWDLRRNRTAFPLHSPGFAVVARYSAGPQPRGGLLLYLTSVHTERRWEELGAPEIRVEGCTITRCGNGLSTRHYNRARGTQGEHYRRHASERITLSSTVVVQSLREAVLVWTPHWYPHLSPLAQVAYRLHDCRISENPHGAVVHRSRDLRHSNNIFHWNLNLTRLVNNSQEGVDLRFPYVWQYDENHTHSVEVANCSFLRNNDFSFSVGGHFARFNMTGNLFADNVCRGGLVHVGGMEKALRVENNVVTDNTGRFMFELSLQSHADKFGLVPARFSRNTFQNNHPTFTAGGGYEPSSYTIGIRGVQPINVTRNIFVNRDFQFELLTGVLTGSLDNSINVRENWWGTVNASDIKERIFDFDDWNSYAVANFSPFLVRESFDAGSIPEISKKLPPNLNAPLGGRIYQSLTLHGRTEPYVVKSDLTIMPDVTLRIEAGATVEFHPSVGILVLGDLVARGTHLRPIRLRPVNEVKYYGRSRRQLPGPPPGVRLCTSELCQDNTNDGFLEIFNSTTLQWVPICDPRFTERNAQVVCKELGYRGLNVIFKSGPRPHLGPVHVSHIRSWPHPLECSGAEMKLGDCEFRLNGVRDSYACSHEDNFVYIYCGEDKLHDVASHWGGIRFSIPDFEQRQEVLTIPTMESAIRIPDSQLENVHITGAGILHGERNAAIQAVHRDIHLHSVTISHCAYHGIELLAPPGEIYFRELFVRDNLGLGLNVHILNGESSLSPTLSYTPLNHAHLPYSIFGMVDICDTNKQLQVEERVLVYYKYDNRPVDCVKIFRSRHAVKMVGLRMLYFNLFNATGFSSQPDFIRVFDGDLFNETSRLLADFHLWRGEEEPPLLRFVNSTDHTLSVQLHVSGGSGALGFVAEVVTIPISHSLGRDLRHNVTMSEFTNNQLGAINYESAGESTPFLSFTRNRFERNGVALLHNFTSSECSVHMDLQNCERLDVMSNSWLSNQGGLCLAVHAHSAPTSVTARIANNLFSENLNREVLHLQSGSSGQRQILNIWHNYVVRNQAPYRSTLVLSRVKANFSENVVTGNVGLHTLELRGFDKVPVSQQTVSHNAFSHNRATCPRSRATVLAASAGQTFSHNYFFNPDNDFELVAGNRTGPLEVEDAPVNADANWWGTNGTSAVGARIWDVDDDPSLLRVVYQGFYRSNTSVISGKCAGGWTKLGDTCFLYIGGVLRYLEAKHMCEVRT